MKPLGTVQAEFDRIADLSDKTADRLGPHEAALLGELPPKIGALLDIGCGTGGVARRLADRCDRVIAIDLSPQMIAVARRHSTTLPHVEYHVAEASEWLRSPDSYDCITCIAMLHHVDHEQLLGRIRDALRPGGTLLVIDLLEREGWSALPVNVIAAAISRIRRLGRSNRAAVEAWRQHGEGETYFTIDEARAAFSRSLPGSRVRQHLIWRYSVIWTKPTTHR